MLIKYPNIQILSDDIYEHVLYGDMKFTNILNVEPNLYKRTFIVNGVSKVFSMTGWRIGYGAGDKSFIKSMSKFNPNALQTLVQLVRWQQCLLFKMIKNS